MHHFSIRLWPVMKNGFYMTTRDDQLSGWTKKQLQTTSQSQTSTKKMVMVTVWWSATCLIHYSFLYPGKTITSEKYAQQINEIHWKLQRLQPALVNRMDPILRENAQLHITQPTHQNLNKLGYEVSPYPLYLPDLSLTNNHFFKHLDNFLQWKCVHNQQEPENIFQEFTEFQSMDFYAIGINKLVSHWQKCIDCNGSYFD